MRKPKAKLKLKTKRAAAKRFKVTASGKTKGHKAFKRHILTKKGPGRRRALRTGAMGARARRRDVGHAESEAGKQAARQAQEAAVAGEGLLPRQEQALQVCEGV